MLLAGICAATAGAAALCVDCGADFENTQDAEAAA